MTDQEMVNKILDEVKPFWRRWCVPSGGCGCMGCFNNGESDKMAQVNTKLGRVLKEHEFLAWAKTQPPIDETIYSR